MRAAAVSMWNMAAIAVLFAFIAGAIAGVTWSHHQIDDAVDQTRVAHSSQIVAVCQAKINEQVAIAIAQTTQSTSDAFQPNFDACIAGWQTAIQALASENEWWQQVSQELNQHGWNSGGLSDQDNQDFVFCMVAQADPFVNCLDQLEAGRR